jgi:hypothetical protein
MAKDTVLVRLAAAVEAHENCAIQGKYEWLKVWKGYIKLLATRLLPSGSGVDRGTHVLFEKSSHDVLVFSMDYHPMDEHGGYKAWTRNILSVRPDFSADGFYVVGKKGELRTYLAELLTHALAKEMTKEEHEKLFAEVSGAR